jgi:hypothetical protein
MVAFDSSDRDVHAECGGNYLDIHSLITHYYLLKAVNAADWDL